MVFDRTKPFDIVHTPALTATAEAIAARGKQYDFTAQLHNSKITQTNQSFSYFQDIFPLIINYNNQDETWN